MDAVSPTEYASWAKIVTTNIPLILMLIVVCFGIIGKLFHLLWVQHKDIERQKKKTEKSELSRVLEKIETLIEQTQFLFKKQDNTNDRIDEQELRIGTVEKKQAERDATCQEREKSVNDKFKNMYRRYDDPPT